jgi:hypothetical protein
MNASMQPTEHATAAMSAMLLRPKTREELLDREEELARQGLLLNLGELGQDACELLDPRSQLRKHPLLSVLIGGVGGLFVVKHWSRILRTGGLVIALVSGLSGLSPRRVGSILQRRGTFARFAGWKPF